MKNQIGFGIIEVIVAMALFITVAVVGLTTVVGSFTVNRLGNEETEATLYAQQGIEAVRSIKNQGWASPFLSTLCSLSCGVSADNSSWSWSGLNNADGDYTRTIMVTTVQRDSNGDIVESGGTDDPDTKKIISKVSWNFTPTRNNTVELSTYLTNFGKAILLAGDWSSPIMVASIDLTGANDALKVQVQGNYAYVVRNAGNPRFAIIDLTDPDNSYVAGSINMAPGAPLNIFVLNDYAYIAGGHNSNELQIVNISNPSSPTLVGSFNTPGNGDANGVFVSDNKAYVVTDSQANHHEFYILNVANPASITLFGSLALEGSSREVVVEGNYAYVTSTDNNQELQVINISNPSSPSLLSSLNLPGDDDALTISLNGENAIIGQGNYVRIVNVSNPNSPILTGSYAAGGLVNDIAINFAIGGSYAFIATSSNNGEFQVIDITNPASISLIGAVDTPGNDDLRGVAYGEAVDIAVGVGDSNSQEVFIFRPQ